MIVDLPHAILSLSTALDFVGVDEIHHGKRVALMAACIAEDLGWSPERRDDLLLAGMLHDCGVSRDREHRMLTASLEWDGAEAHCIRGEGYLRACPPLAHLAPLVRWHHTRWEHLPGAGIAPDDRWGTNLICLADRVDVLVAPYVAAATLRSEILWEFPDVIARIAGFSGTMFAPELVAAFAATANRESFWLALDPVYVDDGVADRIRPHGTRIMSSPDILAIARLLAQSVDAKSTYTLEHSTRVAGIARYLAEAAGFAEQSLDRIEIAALLHDIGKVRVSEDIIDKPAPLTREEWAQVRRHSFDSAHILRKVFPGEPIADWASKHHENLEGTGYPYREHAEDIPPEARLISVADIFQALSQDRPYRDRLGAAEVLARLQAMQKGRRIDGAMVDLLRVHLDHCYAIATGRA